MREMPRAFEGTKKTLQGKWFTQDPGAVGRGLTGS